MLSDIGLTASTKAVRTVAKDSVSPRLVTPVGVRCDLWATEDGENEGGECSQDERTHCELVLKECDEGATDKVGSDEKSSTRMLEEKRQRRREDL